jgi:hypothetical protein
VQLIDRITALLQKRRVELWAVMSIALLSFIIQILCIHGHELYGEPYLIARNIVAGKGFVFVYPYTFHESVTAYIPPLFVFLQVPFLASGLGEIGIQIFNLVCLQAACFIIYRFFRSFVQAPLALLIFFALSFYIPFWALAYSLEPNALNLLLLVSTIYILRNIAEHASTKRFILLGVLIGLQLLVRPDMMLGAVLFSIWLIVVYRKHLKVAINGITLVALTAGIIVAPWTIRNYGVFHKFVLVSANGGMNLFTGNNPVATGEFSETAITPESEQIFRGVLEYSKTHDQIDVDRLRYKLAMQWILDHPAQTASLDAKKALYHWIGRASTGREFRLESETTRNIYRIVSLALIGFGIIGLLQIPKNVRSLLFILFLYSTAISTIFFVQTRHRTLKVDPFLVPLAAIGVVRVLGMAARREIKATNELLTVE